MPSPRRGGPPGSRPGNRQEPELFRQLPHYDPSWRALALSFAAHATLLLAVIVVPLALLDPDAPDKIFAIVDLITPPAPPPKRLPAPPVLARLELPPEPAPPRKPPEPVPAPELPRVEPPKPVVATPPAPAPPEPPPPKPAVKTEVFASAPAPVEPPRPTRTVQTGGFGAPTDAPRDHARFASMQLPATGAFDLPYGPGNGNGTGGAQGARGKVASAGFESAAGPGAGGAGGPRGQVQSGGFDDARAASAAPRPAARPEPDPQVPAEIISKPKPVYTQEARDLRLEGEVLLEVLFTAAGDVRVLRLIQGLGHGLDESAKRAAEQIRFKPALRDGKPVDSRARVQIVFRLA
jgi:TonB family protein